MTANRQPLWTIAELSGRVALALAENYDGQRNGSIRSVPDLRTIRYYTTQGLLDRPAEMRGRTALYGWRHLLQLVAIKRLQTRGLTLVEIQQKLLGLTDGALQRIAQVPEFLGASASVPAEPVPEASRPDFWRQTPAAFAMQENTASTEEPTRPTTMQGVRLSEEVTLLLESIRPLVEDDLEAIRVAAGPLLKLLEKRRLIESRDERRTL